MHAVGKSRPLKYNERKSKNGQPFLNVFVLTDTIGDFQKTFGTLLARACLNVLPTRRCSETLTELVAGLMPLPILQNNPVCNKASG
jgi:hypothetical protein